jgi:hypothetical protein
MAGIASATTPVPATARPFGLPSRKLEPANRFGLLGER